MGGEESSRSQRGSSAPRGVRRLLAPEWQAIVAALVLAVTVSPYSWPQCGPTARVLLAVPTHGPHRVEWCRACVSPQADNIERREGGRTNASPRPTRFFRVPTG